MSAYTTPKDIQSYYMGLDLNKSDYITKSEVRNWITEYSIKIDTSLRRRYTLPITNSNDLNFLKLLAEKFVVGRIDGIMRVSTTDEDKKYLRNRNYTKDANNLMQELMDGKILLESIPKSLSPIGYNQGSA